MNKKDLNQLTKINYRLDALAERWIKEHDRNMKELLELSVLLKNIEDGYLETNEALLAE